MLSHGMRVASAHLGLFQIARYQHGDTPCKTMNGAAVQEPASLTPKGGAGAARCGTERRCATLRQCPLQPDPKRKPQGRLTIHQRTRMSDTAHSSPSSWAQVLGFGGLIPFVGLALASWWAPVAYQADILRALAAYAATIASFVGALHWGAAMHRSDMHTGALLAWGVVPSLVAWLALLTRPVAGLLILATLLVVCFAVDRAVYPRMGLSVWLVMRLRLTAVASISCFAAAMSTIALR